MSNINAEEIRWKFQKKLPAMRQDLIRQTTTQNSPSTCDRHLPCRLAYSVRTYDGATCETNQAIV